MFTPSEDSNRNFFAGVLNMFAATPTKDATKEEWDEYMRKSLNLLGVNAQTQEDADYFYKVSAALIPLDYLSRFLATETKPFKEATPEILMMMWNGKEMLLPLIEQMKNTLADLLEERGICPEYMKHKSDTK